MLTSSNFKFLVHDRHDNRLSNIKIDGDFDIRYTFIIFNKRI